MTKELKLEDGFRYVRIILVIFNAVDSLLTTLFQSIIVLIFFVPYVCFQIPATAVIRRLGPRNFLSAIVLAWGILMIV